MGKGKAKRGQKKKITYKCVVCNGTQEEPVVACDKCGNWHHFACVGIKSIGKKDTWFCDKCKPSASSSIPSHQSISENIAPKNANLTLPSRSQGANRVDKDNDFGLRYDRNHPYYQANPLPSSRDIDENQSVDSGWIRQRENASNISNVSRGTRNRRELELEMIQEERNLSKLRDAEFLRRKYSILMQQERNSVRTSNTSVESRNIAATRKWVQSQQSNNSSKIDSIINKANMLNEDEFIRRLDALRLNYETSIGSENESAAKNPNQLKFSGIGNLLKCEECHMVGEDENFEACLLCCKQYHLACLDIIIIDDEIRYICLKCKNVNGSTPQIQTEKQIPSTTKPSNRVLDFDMQPCGTCWKTDNQERFKNCKECNNSFHSSCMMLTSVKGEFVWICSSCKRHRIKASNATPKQSDHTTSPINDTLPTPPSGPPKNAPTSPSGKTNVNEPTSPSGKTTVNEPTFPSGKTTVNEPPPSSSPLVLKDDALPPPTTGASQTLTTAQIASRHVVTRDLPIFTGQPEQWPMFVSRFENSTKLCGFSNSENLDRLQKCLRGKAQDAVRSRLLTAESVPDIMSTLRMLYGRPEFIVNALMKKIRAQTPPKADQLNTMVDFALAVKNVCATLEQAELHYHLSNPALIQELVDKLPTNFKIDWARHKATMTNVTLSTLGRFLFELATVISTVTEPTVDKDDSKSKKTSGRKETSKKNKDSIEEGEETGSGHVYAHQYQSYRQQSTDLPADPPVKVNANQCRICKKKCQQVEMCPVFASYDVDRRWKELYNQKLCRKCLGQHGRFCNQSKSCGVNGCTFKHHSLLHDERKHSPTSITPNQQEMIARNSNVHVSLLRSVLMRIVPVTLHFNHRCIDTFAYQDDGSDVSMIEECLVAALGISGALEPLCLMWTADIHRKESNSKRIDVEISGQGDFSERFMVRDVRTVESLGLPIQTVIQQKLVEYFPYLSDVPLIDYRNAIPRILIGSDNANLNSPLEIVEGSFSQPIACKSRIGWSLHGRTDDRKSVVQHVNIHRTKCPCQHSADEELHQLVKEHFLVETFGVQFDKNLQFCSKEDERAIDILKTHTRRIGNRFETALLWKYDDITLPDSYGMAFKRLQCLEKHKPETIEAIDKTIQEYLRKGYASKLSEDDIRNSRNARKWYLPIFTVSHAKKPDKIRVVFDGAAKVNGVSLNSLLLKGPDQLSSLVDILRRFREKKVAATGDITEMFPQIKIRREDVNVQRFLWRNGDKTIEPEQYVLERMTFGANCSPASAQFVKNTNALEFEKAYPRAVETITKNHYVDDMLDCQDTEEEMVQLIKDVKKIHSCAGFEIRKFLSNSAAVMKQVNEADGDLQSNSLDMSFGTERVLGLWWNTKTDCFTYSLQYTKIEPDIVNKNRIPTKREFLKILMSIFDPLGLLSHYLIHLKIILQDVWRSDFGWDDEISSKDIQIAWNNWFELLPNVEKIEIPRLYSPKMSPRAPKSIELHVFVDAGEKAFSAVAYLRVEDNDGVDCALAGAKSRVTPLKYLSVPRKELQAALLGSRLITSIENAQTFKINSRQIWSDSNTVLSWLKSDNRKYHQFVAHRVGEILEATNLDEWRWIPSKQNVADEATKWSKPPSFNSSSRWFSGPEFLKLPKDKWPSKVQVDPDTLEEMKIHHAHSHLVVPILVKSERFSNWNKMHRAMAYVGRFISILRAKVNKQIVPHGPLTRSELIESEKRLIRQAQFQDFTEEMILLIRNKKLPVDKQRYVDRSSQLYKCTPYLDDDGIIRMHGRIDSAEGVLYSTKRPIILPRHNAITRLLVAYYHKMYHHRNHRTVFNQIRQTYFIPSLRVVLNSVRSECQKCKNRLARPQPPQMADLPPARLAIGFRAFTFVGIDYFGPMYVVIGRSNEKRWGVLITCLTTRGVHVEIAHRLDTESCIMCIRNFINLRGCPQEIFSDQGTNLKGMDNTLKKLISELDQDLLASEFTTCYTKWNFNPPASPHMGGAWERMVQSVKKCLYEILPTRHPSEDMLHSLLLEICNLINSRPLTDVPLNHEDDEIITPNHFILGSSNGLKPFVEIDIDQPILRSKWMENQRLTDIFWLKFVKEFLPDLTRRTKWNVPAQSIQVGDIVLLVDGTNIRGQYPKAQVIETFIGSNNQVRRARIRLYSHKDTTLKKSVLMRPVTSLAKLDVRSPEIVLSASKDRQTEGSVANDGSGTKSATLPDDDGQVDT